MHDCVKNNLSETIAASAGKGGSGGSGGKAKGKSAGGKRQPVDKAERKAAQVARAANPTGEYEKCDSRAKDGAAEDAADRAQAETPGDYENSRAAVYLTNAEGGLQWQVVKSFSRTYFSPSSAEWFEFESAVLN